MARRGRTTIEWLLDIVSRSHLVEGGCREWEGARNDSGYCVSWAPEALCAALGLAGRLVRVHRALYLIEHGTLDPELHVEHLCGNRWCIEISHLEAVTQTENNRRAILTRDHDLVGWDRFGWPPPNSEEEPVL